MACIARTRTGFRVELNGHHAMVGVFETLQRVVIEIQMRDDASDPFETPSVHAEPMVLRGDLDSARQEVADRMVGSSVTKTELEGLGAEGEREDLVSQADPGDWHLAEQGTYFLDHPR